MPVTRWNDRQIKSTVSKDVARRMDRAVIFLRDEVKRSINRGNPRGTNPSLPGEPPKKVSSRLFQSISKAVIVLPNEIVGVYGSNVVYALRLELGFTGIDSLGRRYDQAPRPYIRPAYQNNKDRLRKILGVR